MRQQRVQATISIQLVTGVRLAAGVCGVSAHQRRAAHRIDEDDGDAQRDATAAGGNGSGNGSEPRDAPAASGARSTPDSVAEGGRLPAFGCAVLLPKLWRCCDQCVL